MKTIAQSDELPRIEHAGSIGCEADDGAIKGILWSLAIIAPIYGAVIWFLIAH